MLAKRLLPRFRSRAAAILTQDDGIAGILRLAAEIGLDIGLRLVAFRVYCYTDLLCI
jgi:hypothetical protein